MTAAALGDPELKLIVLDHPLGGIDAAELGRRADAAAVELTGWLTDVSKRRTSAR
jgi:hypothetical protein